MRGASKLGPPKCQDRPAFSFIKEQLTTKKINSGSRTNIYLRKFNE